MSKKFLSLFAFVLVLVPAFLFVGCGSPKPAMYSVTLEVINQPDEKYFEMTSSPIGDFEENSSVIISLKFKEGYRPDNFIAEINGEEITQATIRDTVTNIAYTSATPLSHEIEWSYELTSIVEDTTFSLDFSDCEVGKVSLALDESLASLKYAILGDKPTTQVTCASELNALIAEQVLTTKDGEISVPYNSYIVFFPSTETTALNFSNTADSTATYTANTTVSATFDNASLDFYECEIDEIRHHIVPTTVGDSWNQITAIASVANLKNVIPNTFAVQTLTDGTAISGLATQSETARNCGQMAKTYLNEDDTEGVFVTKSFTYNGTDRSFYVVGDSKRIYSNIATAQLSSETQCSLATHSSAWVEEDLVLTIEGLCNFNNSSTTDEALRDHYYLSTSPNIEDENCTKVDISDYFIVQEGTDGVAQFFIYIPKDKVQEILDENSGFVTELNGNQYAFAYLVLDKNEAMENIVKMTVAGYDYEDFDLTPTLFGYNVVADSSTIDETSVKNGQVTYVDYTTTVSGKIAPTYCLYKSQDVRNSAIYGINIRLPVLKTDGYTITMYESCDYTITYTSTYDTHSGKLTFDENDYSTPFVGTTKRIGLKGIDSDFTLTIKLNTKAFEESSHKISGLDGQQKSIYYYLTNLADAQGVPTDTSKWSALADTPINTAFDQTKLLFVLANLSTTTTETTVTAETINLLYAHIDDDTDETGSTGDTDATGSTSDTDATGSTEPTDTDTTEHYDTWYEASAYTDMLGNTVTVTIDGIEYQVYYFVLPQGYHNTNEEFFIDIITSTTTIETPTE